MYTVRLTLPADIPDETVFCLGEALVDLADASSALREGNRHTGAWTLEWITQIKPEKQDVMARLALQQAAHGLSGLDIAAGNLGIEETPDINWLEKCYRDFAPFSVGPFFIHGSHYDGPAPEGQLSLRIDAATAFGSGEHETTKGCLQAMLDLKGMGGCPWNILDMGTGSGILAIAAWKLWKAPVLAIDNDPESVRVAQRHAEMNGVSLGKAALSCACGDGFHTPEAERQKPYELILANILAGPVIEMAPDLCRVLDENGYAVLSGMLVEQADLVASAYEGEGLALKKRYNLGEWTTLVMHKGA